MAGTMVSLHHERETSMKNLVAAVSLLASVLVASPMVHGHSGVVVTSGKTPTAPMIDGVISAAEWSNAAVLPFTIRTVPGTLYVMHDNTYLYVAGVMSDPIAGLNSFQLIFDNNHNGLLDLGDNALVTNLGPGLFDDYYNGQCCWLFDAFDGGANDGMGIGMHAGGQATFEIRYPLCSADTLHDFCLHPGSTVGFNIVYQPGNGSFYAGYPSFAPFDPSHFADLVIPQEIVKVGIDIHPGVTPNAINPRSRGKIPVAILSSATFDATTQVAISSLTFGRNGDEPSLLFCNAGGEDVNGDGLLDLVCHFDNALAGFTEWEFQGTLKGSTTSGVPLTGSDSVTIVGR